MRSALLQSVLVIAALVGVCVGINNGVGWLPPLGWSTWNTFQFNISTALIKETALYMAQSPLKAAGYEYILIDDGWPSCYAFAFDGKCTQPAPRDANGRIVVNLTKFPGGFNVLTDYVHGLGLKIGIYTAVSERTCGGFPGSLHHESVDAQSFADWGFDFVKHDTCNTDCPVHNGCLQNSTGHMRDALNATGRPIVYYIDSGNPTSPQRLFNPTNQYVRDQEALLKLATNYHELVWVWAQNTSHMFKSWFDSFDSWESFLTNSHNQIRVAEYQGCGRFNFPDMLTIGQGLQTFNEYQAQMAVWAVLGSPLIIGCDIRNLKGDVMDLFTNPEMLKIDQDSGCVQGSLVRAPEAFDIWIRPLLDGADFAVAVVNKGRTSGTITIRVSPEINGGDFFPALLNKVVVRDIFARRDLGTFNGSFEVTVPPHGGSLLRVIPIN